MKHAVIDCDHNLFCESLTIEGKRKYNHKPSQLEAINKMMSKTSKFLYILVLMVMAASSAGAASRNLLPRFPEIVLEKGFSENFIVTDCQAKVRIVDNEADSSMQLTLQNRSEKTLKSSVKFRVLYPTSSSQIQIRVDGRPISYERESPRHQFELASQQSISFQISARTSINYSIDGVREALRKEHEEKPEKGKKFDLSGLLKLFDREKFGKRFMVGPLASKWGVFPLEFGKVQLEVIVPADFSMVSQVADKWETKKRGRETTYIFNSGEGFEGSVFLPESEREEFIKTQKILTSSEFMH